MFKGTDEKNRTVVYLSRVSERKKRKMPIMKNQLIQINNSAVTG